MKPYAKCVMINKILYPGGKNMDNSGTVKQEQYGNENSKAVLNKVNRYIGTAGAWLFRLRKFIMAAPVLYYALKLAAYNMEHLPQEVGINLQSSGEFAMTIARGLAVSGPLGLTVACLLLMFCSRKAMYPWAVSIFTLALPLLLLISNSYPA